MDAAQFVRDIAIEIRSESKERRWLLNLVGMMPFSKLRFTMLFQKLLQS